MPSYSLISFYAKRLIRSEGIQNTTTKPVIQIAIVGIILGIVAMLISVMVVTGFRNEITRKVTGFVADYRISAFNNNDSYEESPVKLDSKSIESIKSIPGVRHIQPFILKAGLLKTKDDIQGVVLKGFDAQFDPSFFKEKLVEGTLPTLNDSTYTTAILLSQNLANKLRLKTGDSFLLFFIQEDRKVRKLKISGIYNTGLSEEFDNLYLLCDLKMLQQVNNWKNNEVGGYEVFADNGNDDETIYRALYDKAGYTLNTKSTKELYPQLFNWLELQNLNVIVIIGLICLVAGITMISTLLVLIMENTKEIGILKSIGANDKFIGRVFGSVAFYILLKGLIIGNLIALSLAIFQIKTGIVTLPEADYYLAQVPVNFTIPGILLINGVVLITGILVMMIPAKIISGVNPIKVLRFD
ncbi:MAG: ABC transporter permease [Bacteroidetes bacterium]|nr:ABC transporter permease [Bacteroidota bacterium]